MTKPAFMVWTVPFISLLIATLLTSCGGTSSPPAAMQPASENESPGGIWSGTDAEGGQTFALVDEDGSLHFIDGRFARGAGLLTIINGNTVAGVFSFPDRAGLPDNGQGDYPDCKLTGPLAERQSMTLDVSCKSIANQQVLTTLSLTYDPLYETGSSLGTIAGQYDYGPDVVLAVASDGSVYAQNPATGCVTNGRLTPARAAFNLYRIEVMNENCAGQEAEFNGENFAGLATLDDRVMPAKLLFAVTGNSGESVVSIVRSVSRL